MSDNLNKINGNKDLYDRMCVWMADWDDVEAPDPWGRSASAMAEEAMTLFYDIYQTCNDEPTGEVEGVPV